MVAEQITAPVDHRIAADYTRIEDGQHNDERAWRLLAAAMVTYAIKERDLTWIIRSDDRPFSFNWCCQQLGVEVHRARKAVRSAVPATAKFAPL